MDAAELPAHGQDVPQVYGEAFAGPPWNQAPSAAEAYLDRLAGDCARPGFVAALAFDGPEVAGLAVGWTTPEPFPSGRCYPQAAAALGPQRTAG